MSILTLQLILKWAKFKCETNSIIQIPPMPEKIAKLLVEESGKQTTMLLGSQMLQEIIVVCIQQIQVVFLL